MDKKILAAGMQKGFVGVVVAYFLAIALGILAGIWENHYLMIVVQFISTVFIRLFKFLNNLCSRLKIFFKKPNVTESRKKAKNRNNFSFSFRHPEQAEKWICNSTRLLHHPTSGTPNLLTTGPSKQKLFVRFFLPQQRFLGKKLLTIEIRRKIVN